MAPSAASSGMDGTEQAPPGGPEHSSREVGTAEAVLENCFLSVYHTRMCSLPIVNPAITVRALDFRPWRGYWFGALITPWFINLVLLPRVKRAGVVAVGKPCSFSFAGGDFTFLAAHEGELGDYWGCSLLSPVTDIDNQRQAEIIAREAVQAVWQPKPEDRTTNNSSTAFATVPALVMNSAGKHQSPSQHRPAPGQLAGDNGNDRSRRLAAAMTRRGFFKRMTGGFSSGLPAEQLSFNTKEVKPAWSAQHKSSITSDRANNGAGPK